VTPPSSLNYKARLPAPDRRFAFAGLPLDRHRADPIGAQQHIRARHTCFCGLFPDPTMASSRSRSPGPSRTSMPFLIQPDSHINATAGIIRQCRSTSVRIMPASNRRLSTRDGFHWLPLSRARRRPCRSTNPDRYYPGARCGRDRKARRQRSDDQHQGLRST